MELVNAVISISLLLVFLKVLYSYLKRPFTYWEDLGVPSVPGVPLVGSMLESYTKNFHEVDLKRSLKYGKIYGYYENARPVLSVSDPVLLRDIFVKDFKVFSMRRIFVAWDPVSRDMLSGMKGEPWKRLRTAMTPAFTTGKIKNMFSIMKNSAEQLCRNIKSKAKGRKPVDAKSIFGTFTLDVMATAAFGTKLDSHNDPDSPFVVAAKNALNPAIPWRSMMFLLFPGFTKFFRLSLFEPVSLHFFKDVVTKITEERKRTGKKYTDLLQQMLDAGETTIQGNQDLGEDEANLKDIGHEEENEKTFKVTNLKGVTNNQILANSVIFLVGGYETTASTLSFASYLLAINPSSQEKLIAEIDECIRKHQNELNYEAVQDMKYMDMVITETLRIYPPTIRTDRVADEDYKLGDTGIIIKKEQIVSVPVYAMHHDPENFTDPEKFDPLRFTPEEKAKRDAYTYLPFGAGPRNCIGMRFALTEIKICLAYFFSHFRVRRCQQTKVPLEFRTGQSFLQPKEIIFELEEREDQLIKY